MDDDAAARSTRRTWALVTVAAQVVFVASWLVAAAWQGAGYSVLAHSISDMYAVTAPHAWFLVVVLTLTGAVTIVFAWLCVWPSLRAGGWSARVGSILLALSVYGLGDLLTPFERLACRIADAGCSASAQTANLGGTLDTVLTTAGFTFLVGAGFFLAAAMHNTVDWQGRARPTRWFTIAVLVVFVAAGAFSTSPVGGLLERLAAALGAAGIALLALEIARRNERATA
ncbi:DUF998 domain-containing protein [Cellulomonas sp. P5_C6]